MKTEFGEEPRGIHHERMFANFSLDTLVWLHEHVVASTPFSDPRDLLHGSGNFKEYQYLCFPWAVVELKPSWVREMDVEFCYCQAANAASTALTAFEMLSAFARRESENHEIPPFITITCVGLDIKLWVAYAFPKAQGYNEKTPEDITADTYACVSI
jgi:hypothetical protein